MFLFLLAIVSSLELSCLGIICVVICVMCFLCLIRRNIRKLRAANIFFCVLSIWRKNDTPQKNFVNCVCKFMCDHYLNMCDHYLNLVMALVLGII